MKNKKIETTPNTSDGNAKILFIIWFISAIVITIIFSQGNTSLAPNIAYYIAGLLGIFLGAVAPGMLIGLFVMFITWIIKRDSDKALDASILSAIIVNFFMLWVKLG